MARQGPYVSITNPLPAGTNSLGSVSLDAGTDSVGTVGLDAGEEHVGQVGGEAAVGTLTVAAGTVAYASGDLIGTKMTWGTAFRSTKYSGYLSKLVWQDPDAQEYDFDVVIWKADPSNTTFTDNSALDVDDDDLLQVAEVVNVYSSDFASFADNSVAQVEPKNLVVGDGADLYVAVVARGTPTYAGTPQLLAFMDQN